MQWSATPELNQNKYFYGSFNWHFLQFFFSFDLRVYVFVPLINATEKWEILTRNNLFLRKSNKLITEMNLVHAFYKKIKSILSLMES